MATQWDDMLPYDKRASEAWKWKSDGIEDHYGLHKFKKYPVERGKILGSILEAVGGTPLVKLNKIPQEYGVECNMYGKCEFLNAGGSIKDRIVLRMVELAEECGRLKPGTMLVEPTSGNTGIGLSYVAACRGYPCTIVMPKKMSHEKEVTIKALGAKIERSDDDAPYDSDKSHIGIAFKLHRELKESVVLDQYLNCGNPLTHYESTAEEILEALDGKVDMIVVGVGTGGSITGIEKKIKEKLPNCKVVGVDPIGSVLAGSEDEEAGHFEVEGIGYDFVPAVLDLTGVDEWEKTGDKETFNMARKLNRDEGILSGGSSGAILCGALKAAKTLKKGQNCVFLLPDGIRNYLTKFPNDEWMLKKKFMDKADEPSKLWPKNTFDINEIYDPEKPSTDPYQHLSEPWPTKPFNPKRPFVMQTMAEAIGRTPLVRLNRIPKEEGVESEILVKAEYLNAGGSIKDRIALRMIEIAETTGHLKPGVSTIIEPTSGNTGIGLAMLCACRGYRCIIVMPEKMSKEKECVLKALGAEIVRTKSHHKYNDPDSHIGVALRLQREIPDSIILDQYRNVGNPLSHYEGTAEEILYACDDKIDAIVIGAGTGGTISGIARKFKERVPNCKIIAVDPEGSLLANPENKEVKAYEVEGTGYDFVPAVLDRSLVDEWIKTNDADSFSMARRLIRQEGMLCGGSSGANVWAAIQVAKKLGPGKRVVTVLPDSIRNYMTKFVDDEWLKEKGFDIKT
ncbi:hypothetical protein M3Y94_01306700 [Aphelenchoides besseyi]|nr:hypothetical protein M3Y94_01306700 [Aphelenchoides besseyi]KAI6220236.1 Cystathionine beta-synthase [Aphelenchoides besseyi]